MYDNGWLSSAMQTVSGGFCAAAPNATHASHAAMAARGFIAKPSRCVPRERRGGSRLFAAAAADVGPQPVDLLWCQGVLPRWHRTLALHHRLLEALGLVDRKLAQVEHRRAGVDHVEAMAVHTGA